MYDYINFILNLRKSILNLRLCIRELAYTCKAINYVSRRQKQQNFLELEAFKQILRQRSA